MKVILVEDELPALQRLRKMVVASPHFLEIVGEAHSGELALEQIHSLRPDAIFLDIHLMDMTGFELLAKLQHHPYVIFTTAYQEYALKAFEFLSVDYLLKPFDQTRFDKAVQKLMQLQTPSTEHAIADLQTWVQQQRARPQHTLPIKDKDRIRLIAFEEIAYFKAEDKYVQVVLANGKQHLLSKSLSQLALELPDSFLRVHRSYILNRDYVYELQRYFKGRFVIKLNDRGNTTITSSELYQTEIKAVFGL